jgi:thiopeptide-type bacteriocin biosynthesis protein
MGTVPDSAPNERRFAPADFFLLRSPALPIDRLEALGDAGKRGPEGSGSSSAGARDALNAALQEWVRDPLVQAAIYLASPSLSERVSDWLRQPSDATFDALRPALFRYFVRMTSRATPFGLFASISVGRVGGGAFEIGSREALRRRTWLDLGYVYPLVAQTVASREPRVALNYVPNSTLIRTDDGWRYVEETVEKERRRRDLARVQPSDILDQILISARQAPSFDALIDLILAQAPDVEHADAVEYLNQLIDSQLLVPTLAPTLTGPDPVQNLIRMSGERPELAQFHHDLQRAAWSLQEIDRQDVESLRDAYRTATPHLLGQLASADEKHLFHVDLRRDAPDLALPASVCPQVLRAVEALRSITAARWPAGPLAEFRLRFTERYGDRDVPLMEALDEDTGIGFEIDPGSRRNEHLLADFKFGAVADRPKPANEERRTACLIDLLERAWSQRQRQISLNEGDISELAVENAAPLPDLFTVLGCLASPNALPGGDGDGPCFVLESVVSGAGLFGRFCRSDAELEGHVKALLRSEEALQPDAIFAELVHLPDDRVGNVVCRPALRAKDLPCLGQSGLARADQIPVADLTVTVEGGRIVLRSRELGREVLPRLTCAHNVLAPNASVYRFLAALAKQDGVSGLSFGWGPFADARYLPRVVFGNVVLSPASWRIDKPTIAMWLGLSTEKRQREIREWCTREGIPRWVQVGQHDNLLSLDLDNPWCVDALADDLRRSHTDRVSELIPAPDNFWLHSPEGRHAHEVMIPFVRRAAVQSVRKTRLRGEEPADLRRFTPGSRWLYAKLYGSARATEAVLASELHPLIEKWRAAGSIDRWHFVRYRDSDDHLRVRFHGALDALRREVQPALEELFQRVAHGSAIWRCQFDTYEREATRYGGAEAIELAERIFDVDSETVAGLLRAAPSDASPDWRWLLSARFVDAYYEEFSLDLEGRERHAKRTEAAFRREFRVDAGFEGQLSQRFRKERSLLDALFADGDRFPDHLRWAQAIADAFQGKLSPLAAEFRSLSRRDRLSATLEDISASLAHMHVNRMMLSNPREHELIIHAFLHRICRGRLARRKESPASGATIAGSLESTRLRLSGEL